MAELERRRHDYVSILFEWNDHLHTNLAWVGTYFGEGARVALDQLCEAFSRVGADVEALVRAARVGEDTSERGAEAPRSSKVGKHARGQRPWAPSHVADVVRDVRSVDLTGVDEGRVPRAHLPRR